MTRKKQLAFGLGAIILGLAAIFYLRLAQAQTLDRIEIIEETDQYVELRAGGETGRLFKSFSFAFDDSDFLSWFGPQGWTQMSLLSPLMSRDADYTALSRAIIQGEAGFVDNSVSPLQGAARFEAVDPGPGMVTSKADVKMARMWFIEGDDLWFRGRFLLQSGVPYSLVDFEDNNQRGSPGIRIVIDNQRFIGIELKAARKPRLRQQAVELPRGVWFELVLHLGLDAESGAVRIWQDGVLIIDGQMQTLPSEGSLLNSFEIGITATDMAAVMLLDDVSLGHQPF